MREQSIASTVNESLDVCDHIEIGIIVLIVLQITSLDVYIDDGSKLSNDDDSSIEAW